MKRRTKEQREIEEKAALRRRVLDMAFGAFGYYVGAEAIEPSHPEHGGMFGTMSPGAVGRWMGAVGIHLLKVERGEAQHYLLKPHCLGEWDNLDAIVDKLYEQGVRA